MNSPRVILLFGRDPAAQRAVGSELSDLLPRSLVVGFATPLREAYRTTYDLPRSHLLSSASEAEKVADWCEAFRGFLREWGGREVLGNLLKQTIRQNWYAHPQFIIEDGSEEYINDIRVLAKEFRGEMLLVNFGDSLPLKSNSHAVCSITDREDPTEIASYIHQNL